MAIKKNDINLLTAAGGKQKLSGKTSFKSIAALVLIISIAATAYVCVLKVGERNDLKSEIDRMNSIMNDPMAPVRLALLNKKKTDLAVVTNAVDSANGIQQYKDTMPKLFPRLSEQHKAVVTSIASELEITTSILDMTYEGSYLKLTCESEMDDSSGAYITQLKAKKIFDSVNVLSEATLVEAPEGIETTEATVDKYSYVLKCQLKVIYDLVSSYPLCDPSIIISDVKFSDGKISFKAEATSEEVIVDYYKGLYDSGYFTSVSGFIGVTISTGTIGSETATVYSIPDIACELKY